MLTLGQTLSYYKRKDVSELLVEFSSDKEIAVRFNDFFGKRPDSIKYENDVLEFAKKGATSFHCSEELWNNPLQLNSTLKKNDLDNLRTGWDLILDIDCPYWTFSKLITYVFIKAIKDHNINCVSVKFSGNKGFHIAVPFEAFPKKIGGVDVKNLFPEGPRKLAEYLLHYVNNNLIEISENKIKFGKASVNFETLLKESKKTKEELIKISCSKCLAKYNPKKTSKFEHICQFCETIVQNDLEFMKCPKCAKLMIKKNIEEKCNCGSKEFKSEFDLSSIVAVDTVLISSRHLYRMPYSLHEKSGLVSIPFDIKHILNFEKEEAKILNFKKYSFLDRTKVIPGEATTLFQKAFEFENSSTKKNNESIIKKFNNEKKEISSQNIIIEKKQIPKECFPPCILKISNGLEDGKKRALFILIKFLDNCNWDYEDIEKYIFEWNDKCSPDQLKESYITGQLRYYKSQKEKTPAPNCDNKGYFIDTQFCNPDGLCRGIKNPIQYAKKKSFLLNSGKVKIKKVQDEKIPEIKKNRKKSSVDTKNISKNIKNQKEIIDVGKSQDNFE